MCHCPSHGPCARWKIRSRPSSSRAQAASLRAYTVSRPSRRLDSHPSFRSRVTTTRTVGSGTSKQPISATRLRSRASPPR